MIQFVSHVAPASGEGIYYAMACGRFAAQALQGAMETGDARCLARARRAFSHGCVRVADPLALAQFALEGVPGWSPGRIGETMDAGETVRVSLPAPIRVYIVYGTALALENGEVRFYDDVYGLDEAP